MRDLTAGASVGIVHYRMTFPGETMGSEPLRRTDSPPNSKVRKTSAGDNLQSNHASEYRKQEVFAAIIVSISRPIEFASR